MTSPGELHRWHVRAALITPLRDGGWSVRLERADRSMSSGPLLSWEAAMNWLAWWGTAAW